MCGIVGRIARNGTGTVLPESRRIEAMRCIGHRGPDAQGQYSDGQLWLGHNRLSILDLSDAAGQPMPTEDGRFVICYNGEVYNFVELARSLGLDNLRTHSDTEVLLRAFAAIGIESVKQFNGIFAFAIYDKLKQKIWLVRDRLGVKPLYYQLNEQGLSFASEIKALLALDEQAPRCDVSALHEWLYYGTSLGEKTLYRDIVQLLPGHYLELDMADFTVKQECYWSPAQYAKGEKFGGSVDEQIHQVRHLLEAAVKRQLVSDVPVGVFLSGGIDSSAITAFASRHYDGKLATYSVGFDYDKGINELPKAKALAEHYGTDHHELHIAGVDVADVVLKMVEHHDAPFSDAANIPLYLLSSQINDTTKVVLQGDGGDEIFGGYSRYTTLSFYNSARFLGKVGQMANRLTPPNPQHYRRRRYINALSAKTTAEAMAFLLTEEDVLSNPATIFAADFRQKVVQADPFLRYRQCQNAVQGEDIINQMLMVDSMIILPDIFLQKVDRSTMAASVEVRVPFLDNDLVDFCLRLSGRQKVRRGEKKWLLKKALEGVVPHDILYGKKTGFGVPYGFWLRESLRPLFFDQLETFQNQHPGVLDKAVILALYKEHSARRRDRSFLLWKILNFMIWANRYKVSFE